jgi:hypothetical protein
MDGMFFCFLLKEMAASHALDPICCCRFALPPVPTGMSFSHSGHRSLLSLVNTDSFLSYIIGLD